MPCCTCGKPSGGMRYCKTCHCALKRDEGRWTDTPPANSADVSSNINGGEGQRIVGTALRGWTKPNSKHTKQHDAIWYRWIEAWDLVGYWPEVSEEVRDTSTARICKEVIGLAEYTPFTKHHAAALLERIRYLWELWDIWGDVDRGRVLIEEVK